MSNYFPRAAHSHLVHPPGCLAWIEAWAFFSPQTFSICYLAEDSRKSIAATSGTPPDPGLGPRWLGSRQEMGQGQALRGDVGRDAACRAARSRGWVSPSCFSPALMSPMSFFAAFPARAARTCLPWPPAERWYASILPACPCVSHAFSFHTRPPPSVPA